MQRYTDVLDADSMFYVSDDVLDDQASTICFPDSTEVLVPGVGIVAVRTPFESGLARVIVEVHENEPAPSSEQWDGTEWCEYRTDFGPQRVRDCNFEECQDELAGPLTPPGQYVVHIRAYWRISPQAPVDDDLPVDALYLLQMWT